MNLFAELMKESVIVQGLLAIIALGGTFALLLLGRPVSNEVWLIDSSIVAFFFGAKSVMSVRAMAQDAIREFLTSQARAGASRYEGEPDL